MMTFEELLENISIDSLAVPVFHYDYKDDNLIKNGNLYYHFLIDEKSILFNQKELVINIKVPYIFSASSEKDDKANEEADNKNDNSFFSLYVPYDTKPK